MNLTDKDILNCQYQSRYTKSYIKVSAKLHEEAYKRLWMLLSIVMLSLLGLSACSKTENYTDKAIEITDAAYEKGLLEQAVDWCNSRLFDEKQDYGMFTLEHKSLDEEEYAFLIMQKQESNSRDLFYLQCEGGQLKKVISCGGGEKSLFSYEPVKINDEAYAAVYCADESLKGAIKLFPLNDTGKVYILDDAINNNREAETINEEDGFSYIRSQFYGTGKLKAEYTKLNYDMFTDIRLTGYIYDFIQYPWDDRQILTNIIACTRTYYYDNKLQQFVLQNDKRSYVYRRIPSAFDYTGYMDEHPQLVKNNPKYDYDGDGLMDRIYKEDNKDTGESSFYVHFGNSNKLLLTDRQYGFLYSTYAADLTGDGVNEIIFEQFSTSTKSDNLYYSIASYKDGTYEIIDIPYFHADPGSEKYGPMLYLPLIMSKPETDKVSIYQPDSGYRGYITTEATITADGVVEDEMEHLFPDEQMENRLGYYQVNNMDLIETGENGRKAFLLRSYLGDKWCSKSVDWKLEYISGEWKITGVYQADPIRIKIGEEYSADLDGDKKEDKIYYEIQTVSVNGSKADMPELKINDREYELGFLWDKQGANISRPSNDNYYIIDIDTKDDYRELAIMDEDINGDPGCHFFRYIGNELIYCGYVPGIPNHTLYNYGSGEIKAMKRLNILQNRYSFADWKLNTRGVLEEAEKEIYYGLYIKPYESIRYKTERELILFKTNDMSSDTITINEGEEIRLSSTDNKHWIEIMTDSGISGWLYLEGNKLILPGKEERLEDLFPGL